MKVLGMKREEYIGQSCEGHNCDFTYKDQDMVRHHLYIEDNGIKYKFTLEDEEGECGSGWTTANWVNLYLEEISEFPSDMLKSKIDKEFDMVNKEMESYGCDFFNFHIDGGDSYYPSGYYTVTEELFGKS